MKMELKLDATEFWTLVGLATLAGSLTDQMTTITRAVAKITREKLDDHDYGHAADLVYTLDISPTAAVRDMLRNLGVEHSEGFVEEDSDD